MNRFNNCSENPTIVLINPPVNRWRLYKWYSPLGSREPCLGLLYIASYIKSKGYKVHILDGGILGRAELFKRLLLIKPDIIGITSTTFSFNTCSDLIKELRQSFPRNLIIMGGSHPTALPIDTLSKIPELDGVVVGEGEETTLEIIQRKPPDQIEGLAWRKDSNDEPVLNKSRALAGNLDKYKLNWELLEGFPFRYSLPYQSRKKNAASIVVSRGCFYNCSFCASVQIWQRKLRIHSPQYVLDVMNELEHNYNINHFYFHDDYFPGNIAWMKKFCSLLINQKKGFTWSCASRPEVLSEELLATMKLAGCSQIGVGVESGSQKILNIINKQISEAALSRGIKRISRSGIEIKGYLILDSPGELFSDLYKTFKFIILHKFSDIQINYYNALPGSADHNKYNKSERYWDKMSLQHCIGYSGKTASYYLFIELTFYFFAYLKKYFFKMSGRFPGLKMNLELKIKPQ